MIAQIDFGHPRDVGPNDLDGVVIRFPFTVHRVAVGARQDTITEYTVDVKIGGTLFPMWGLGLKTDPLQNPPLIKTLFESAREEVVSKLQAGTLQNDFKITLQYGSVPDQNPYDLAKIPNPDGFSFRLEIPKPPIGFRASEIE